MEVNNKINSLFINKTISLYVFYMKYTVGIGNIYKFLFRFKH